MIKKSVYTSPDIAEKALEAIDEVKGREVLAIDLRNIPNSVSDFFIICHGTSNTHVEAIARSVQKHLFTEVGENPVSTEGRDKSEWILLDYFNVVVHVFKEEARRFYNLEKLWADADVTSLEHTF
ncbi:ribosome silencing factor [Cryomorphaceae bacterium 1068]|nr:ribosome silencing factor [Cryomorphaceae bacterium 1068]